MDMKIRHKNEYGQRPEDKQKLNQMHDGSKIMVLFLKYTLMSLQNLYMFKITLTRE